MALGVSAQNFTLWYGANYGKETSADNNTWHFANFGIDYTAPIKGKFCWTAGLGYNTKGDTDRIGYVQAEGNVGYNAVESGKFSLQLLTGPFVAIKVNHGYGDDMLYYSNNNESPDYPCFKSTSYNVFSCGWQVGVQLCYSRVALKTGFEQAFTNVYGGSKTCEWFVRLGVRL